MLVSISIFIPVCRSKRAVERFENGLQDYSLAAVSVNERAPWLEEVENVLLRNEYSKVETFRGYGIWLRTTTDALP